MTFDADQVKTVTVDSYGTLVDPSAVERTLADYVDETEAISNLWRSRSLLYTMVSNDVDAYQPFYDMIRDALEYALGVYDVDLPEEDVEDVLSTYHDLDAFEDVREGLERIRGAGYDVYVLSNGNPAMLESMVDTADIGDVITDTISVHEIRRFKPEAEIYRHAAGRTGTPIHAIAHVAGPTFDVQGAMHAGMQGVWLDRAGRPWDGFAPRPDLTIASFHDLVDVLVGP